MRLSLRYRVARVMNKFGFFANPSKNKSVQNMRKELSKLKNHQITFRVEMDRNGNWAAEALEFPGMITGGTAEDSFAPLIEDAICTYFEIPPEYCYVLSQQATKTKNKPMYIFDTTPQRAIA